MEDSFVKARIVVDPHVHFGKPCVTGTRIPVQSVLELVRDGIAFDEIIRDYYPDLEPDDIPMRWTADGGSLFVYRPSAPPLRVETVDVKTGRRTLWKELRPADPSGVERSVIVTDPRGPTTSRTKCASWLIIGPHPDSNQPSEPSSNRTWSWP